MSTSQDHAVAMTLASVRASLKRAPAFLTAAALAAGLSAHEAQAWSGEYQNLGGRIGEEVARSAAGGGYGAKPQIAGMIGTMIGRNMGAPLDASTDERRRIERATAQAREQAARDAAYEAERRRIDPNYSRAAASSQFVNQGFNPIGSNLRDLQIRSERLSNEYHQRNGLTQR